MEKILNYFKILRSTLSQMYNVDLNFVHEIEIYLMNNYTLDVSRIQCDLFDLEDRYNRINPDLSSKQKENITNTRMIYASKASLLELKKIASM